MSNSGYRIVDIGWGIWNAEGNSSHPRSAIRDPLLLTLLLVCTSVQAAGNVFSVRELKDRQGEWPEMLEAPFKVEGRVGSVSRVQFRFIHCDATFRVTEEQSRTIGSVRNVEVSGRFKRDKDNSKIFFAVDRVKILPSDSEEFESREAKLKTREAKEWYELADWADSRGEFYQDDDLRAKGRKARTKGLEYERINLAADDFEGRVSLAERLRKAGGDAELVAELTHEAARIHWSEAQRTRSMNLFLAWLKKTYPASVKPLEEIPRELARRYDDKPNETFQKATPEDRDILTRLLYLKVESARILAGAKADNSNAAEIAEELAARVPERTDLIEKYRGEGMKSRLKSVGSASRAEAVRLSEELKAEDKPLAAKEVLLGWIRAQEARVRKNDPIALIQIAEDYLQLLKDEPMAVKRLIAAHELDPSLEDAGDRLKQLGYRQLDQQWIKGGAADGPSPDAHGQLAVGMSGAAVLQLLGEPTGKTRILSRSGTQEVWSFSPRGSARLFIHLTRPAGQPPRVTKFFTAQ